MLAADPARVDKLVKFIAPMIYTAARSDAAMYMRTFRDIVLKETGIDIFIKLRHQSPRFKGTIGEVQSPCQSHSSLRISFICFIEQVLLLIEQSACKV